MFCLVPKEVKFEQYLRKGDSSRVRIGTVGMLLKSS